ncbi:MAG: hypothetical protein HFE62_04235 [Firmicutes bacterium]|nr:hypothetical protein [Bacillota bacterium]
MNKKFPSVYNLVDEDPLARKYYNSLPNSVRNAIGDRAKNITTFDLLKQNAEEIQNGKQ